MQEFFVFGIYNIIKENEQSGYDKIMPEFGMIGNRLKYQDVVRKAKGIARSGYGNIDFQTCELWEKSDQINLWTFWQGYQLKDIDEKGTDGACFTGGFALLLCRVQKSQRFLRETPS